MTPLDILTAVANSLWQAAALAGLLWLALKCLRINAATRCVLWWAVLAMLFVLPLAPRFSSEWGRPRMELAAPRQVGAIPALSSSPLTEEVGAARAIVTFDEKTGARWPLAVFALWAAACAYRLAGIGQSYIFLRSVKRRATVADFALPHAGRKALVLISGDIASPMAAGFLRPAVILPRDLTDKITREELDQILLHELAHLIRRDDWWNLLARLVGAVLALHPVAWGILRQIEYEREAACDDWVVARTGAARPYAESLARMAELQWQGATHAREALASGVFGGHSRIGDRIEMLLRYGREFSPRASLGRVTAGVIALCCVAAGSSLAPQWIGIAKATAPRRIIAQANALPPVPAVTSPATLVAQAVTPAPGAQPAAVAAAPLAFEAAAIRKSDPNPPRVSAKAGPENLAYSNVTLEFCIERAFGLKDYQVTGPDWINSERYVIEARTSAPVSNQQMMAMLQGLLRDRFHLTFHRMSKSIPVYSLEPEGDHHGIKPSQEAEDSPNVGVGPGHQEQWKRVLSYTRVTMKTLAESLSGGLVRADLPVIDRTGLDGLFDFILKFDTNASDPPSLVDGADVPATVSKELGIHVIRTNAPIDVLVVDGADSTPTEN